MCCGKGYHFGRALAINGDRTVVTIAAPFHDFGMSDDSFDAEHVRVFEQAVNGSVHYQKYYDL